MLMLESLGTGGGPHTTTTSRTNVIRGAALHFTGPAGRRGLVDMLKNFGFSRLPLFLDLLFSCFHCGFTHFELAGKWGQ